MTHDDHSYAPCFLLLNESLSKYWGTQEDWTSDSHASNISKCGMKVLKHCLVSFRKFVVQQGSPAQVYSQQLKTFVMSNKHFFDLHIFSSDFKKIICIQKQKGHLQSLIGSGLLDGYTRDFSWLVGTNIISELHVYISMLSYSFTVKAVTTVCGKMIYCCPQNVFGNRMFTSLGILPCINIFNLLHVGIFWLQNKGF